MEEPKAHRVQNTSGVKSNRDFNKPDFVSKHRPSKVKLNDPRRTEIKLSISSPKSAVKTPLTVELWKLEKEKRKWESMGYDVHVCN